METVDLSTDDGLRRACEAVERENPGDKWCAEVVNYLREIADQSLMPERFASEAFQRRLWIDTPITHSRIFENRYRKSVEEALSQKAFRQRFLELYRGTSGRWSNPPRTEPVSVEALVDLAKKVRDLLEETCHEGQHYVLYRTLAALFPTKFTTIASLGELSDLAKRMDIDPRRSLREPEKVLEQHRQVLNRLEKVFGTIDPNSLSEVAQRMTLPWRIVELVKSDEEMQPSDEARPEEANEEGEKENLTSIRVPEFSAINEQLEEAGHFPLDLCRQLHLGLWANDRRHFAILTGISGSGKTLLARKYAEALTGTEKPPRVCVVPVQPGWTDPSFLLGYPNPLKGDSYERTQFLKLLLSAKDKPGLPHVAILDEMNLSHPEQYLAQVLSAMETGDALELHGREDNFDDVPRSIPYPSNLVLIGTVNMDETTMGLSDKVLDRAFTLEFWDIDVDAWPGWNSHGLSEDQAGQVKVVLKELMTALKPARLHFGYRVIDEVLAFLKQREQQTPDWDFTKALDGVIYAKVLPKLRGDDSPRIQTAFDKCKKVLDARNLEECAKKVEELKADLESTGSARFWR